MSHWLTSRKTVTHLCLCHVLKRSYFQCLWHRFTGFSSNRLHPFVAYGMGFTRPHDDNMTPQTWILGSPPFMLLLEISSCDWHIKWALAEENEQQPTLVSQLSSLYQNGLMNTKPIDYTARKISTISHHLNQPTMCGLSSSHTHLQLINQLCVVCLVATLTYSYSTNYGRSV